MDRTNKLRDKASVVRLAKESVVNMVPYVSSRDAFSLTGYTCLDANESPYDQNRYNRYQEVFCNDIRDELARQMPISRENIIVGNGSDEVIEYILVTFCEPRRDNIVVIAPTFDIYRKRAEIHCVEGRVVPLVETKDYALDVEGILQAQDSHTKCTFLPSPNNPTGNQFSKSDILRLLTEGEGLVVVDEAYIEYAAHDDILPLIHEHPHLIVLRTFSKAWGLAGLRIGMGYADPETIHLIEKVKYPYNVNTYAREQALLRLQSPQGIQEQIHQILQQKAPLGTFLKELPFVDKVYPSDANFFFVRLNRDTDPKHLYDFLIQKGLVIRNLSDYPHAEQCVRVTIGTPAQNQYLMQSLGDYEKLNASSSRLAKSDGSLS